MHQKQEELQMLQVIFKVVISSGMVSSFFDRQSVLRDTFCTATAKL